MAALCDVDAEQRARLKAGRVGAYDRRTRSSDFMAGLDRAKQGLSKASEYADYRVLFDKEKSLDAVIISVGQRWHVPMIKASLRAGLAVYCEKPLAHSVAEAREVATTMKAATAITQIGTQGGATDAFRRSMEIIQSGLLGDVLEVHCWMDRTFPPSETISSHADPVPAELNWDAWCGPSPLHPFRVHYLGTCLNWGRWLDYGDGHLADMGAHALNLPLRALDLPAPTRVSVVSAEPVLDSYPSKNDFRWDFSTRPDSKPVSMWWHDGPGAAPPRDLCGDLMATYGRVPSDGCLFVGEKGLLFADAWGQKGVMRLKSDASPKCRGVLDHEAAKPLPVKYRRAKDQNHMKEFLDACRGEVQTFQNFAMAARSAEITTTGIVALRLGRGFEWDSGNLRAKGAPDADRWIHLPRRGKWVV